jgi:hypothetical protein
MAPSCELGLGLDTRAQYLELQKHGLDKANSDSQSAMSTLYTLLTTPQNGEHTKVKAAQQAIPCLPQFRQEEVLIGILAFWGPT